MFLLVTHKEKPTDLFLGSTLPSPQQPMTAGLPVRSMGFQSCARLSSSTAQEVNVMIVNAVEADSDDAT